MNNKLTMNDLVDEFSAQTSLNKKDATAFVREFQNGILEGLEKDGIVKVNGLGTFKLVRVATRKSVDVNTGESIEIPAHYKVNFNADGNLRESLNGSGEESDPLKRMAEQADELKEILAEMGSAPSEEKKVAAKVTKKTKKTVRQEDKPAEKETKKEEKVEVVEEKKAEPIKVEVKEEKEEKEPVKVEVEKKEKEVKPQQAEVPMHEEEKGRSYVWLVWVTLVCVLLLGAGMAYYLFTDDVTALITGKKVERAVIVKPEPRAEVDDEEVLDEETGVAKEVATTEKSAGSETIATERIAEGTSLAYYARKYYGHPDFWIYIYEANRDVLKDANGLVVGTRIRIPRMAADVVNANDPATIQRAIERAKGVK